MNSWRYEETASPKAGEWNYAEAEQPLPEEVKQWLAKLTLLEGVPLNYLVPSEKLLPMESIRFFVLDPQWIQALRNGALNPGRVTEPEAMRDAVFSPVAAQAADGRLRKIRQSRMHPNHRHILHAKRQEDEGVLSGFFLRSVLVAHWKGIELRGYHEDRPLALLRAEALSDRLLLCLFEGEITRVELLEPKEELHFGTRGNDRTIDLRRVDEGHEGEPLLQVPDDPHTILTHAIPTAANGRVDVLKLAGELEPLLGLGKDTLNSAHLALEMLSVAGWAEFTRSP